MEAYDGKTRKNKSEKIETCFVCNREFNINADDLSRYRHGKYPMCAFCVEFYGFYFD